MVGRDEFWFLRPDQDGGDEEGDAADGVCPVRLEADDGAAQQYRHQHFGAAGCGKRQEDRARAIAERE